MKEMQEVFNLRDYPELKTRFAAGSEFIIPMETGEYTVTLVGHKLMKRNSKKLRDDKKERIASLCDHYSIAELLERSEKDAEAAGCLFLSPVWEYNGQRFAALAAGVEGSNVQYDIAIQMDSEKKYKRLVVQGKAETENASIEGIANAVES